jgi:transposase-like protein
MARRTIDPAVKTAVLVAALEEGAHFPTIAKQYNVSLPTIYNWRNAVLAERAAAVASVAQDALAQ